jgi:hypothetical protein
VVVSSAVRGEVDRPLKINAWGEKLTPWQGNFGAFQALWDSTPRLYSRAGPDLNYQQFFPMIVVAHLITTYYKVLPPGSYAPDASLIQFRGPTRNQ